MKNTQEKTINGRTAQQWKDWWIDGLIRLGIPMLKNEIDQSDGTKALSEGCIYAQARGATLIDVPNRTSYRHTKNKTLITKRKQRDEYI